MRYRLKLLITSSALLCVLLAQAAPAAESCVKTLYIDGVQVGQKTADQGLTWPYERITIGSESNRWYLYNEYVGKMDEFAIYKGVMDPNRIKAHYDANSNYTNYKNAVQADNPLLWLKFDDASTANGATALNSGSIGINGEYVSTGDVNTITKTAGINADSNAIVFPGRESVPDSAGNCVDVWDGNGDFSSDLDGDVTIELWVNFADANGYPRFFQHNGQWNMTGGYGVMVNGPNQVGIIGGSTTNYVDLATEINDANWHHIVVTYDSTYEVPLTEAYTAEVMADDPCLYLRFEQLPLVDSSGHNYWARANSLVRVEKTAGSMGNAAYLGGGWVAAGPNQTEPCLPVQYGPAYAIAPNDVTFEFWLKTSEPGAVDGYVGLFIDSNGEYAPGMSRADTKCRMQFGRPNNPSGPHCYSADGAWPTDTNWHHFVVEYNELPDANGNAYQINVKLYRDMVSYKDSTYGPGTPCTGSVGPYMDHILLGHNSGSRDAPSNTPYRQYIDEFAVYHGCLSFDRIQAHYYAWAPKSCVEWRDRAMPMAVADKNQDCRIDFDDFARFALSWRKCNDPCDAGCTPNW